MDMFYENNLLSKKENGKCAGWTKKQLILRLPSLPSSRERKRKEPLNKVNEETQHNSLNVVTPYVLLFLKII